MTDLIFQKNLQGLIKGIRSNRKNPAGFISQSIAEAKSELRSNDPYIKAEAVSKLTYLQMIGYDVSWASFAIVEVMSLSRFAHKRIGFLASNQVSCRYHHYMTIFYFFKHYVGACMMFVVVYREDRCVDANYKSIEKIIWYCRR